MRLLVDLLHILVDIELEDSFGVESAELQRSHVVLAPLAQVSLLLLPPVQLVTFMLSLQLILGWLVVVAYLVLVLIRPFNFLERVVVIVVLPHF